MAFNQLIVSNWQGGGGDDGITEDWSNGMME